MSSIKRSPVLKQAHGCTWMSQDNSVWLCGTVREWFDLVGYSKIWICGATAYTPGCVEMRPTMSPTSTYEGRYYRDWYTTEQGIGLYSEFANWLRAFDAPCVWVWVEGV